eukprot:Selendium_serpulae@DN11614_c0_g1_i1.p1
MYLARATVNYLARHITKWTTEHDNRIMRVMGHLKPVTYAKSLTISKGYSRKGQEEIYIVMSHQPTTSRHRNPTTQFSETTARRTWVKYSTSAEQQDETYDGRSDNCVAIDHLTGSNESLND